MEPGNGFATGAAVPSSPAVDEHLVSSLRTQAELDLLCKKHGIPTVYTARPAGDDRRACTPPPPGCICVYAGALEAGMRVPLHGFCCEVLAHFGIAPAQLVPNGWRFMAGFLALCRTVGVPPSLAVFRRIFGLYIVSYKKKGWYCFRARDRSGGLRFTGMPNTPMDWKKLFFFLSSPEPWPCPVEWGEPSKISLVEPVLIGEEKKWEAKILGAYGGGGGGAPVDIITCLSSDGNLSGATSRPPLPSTSSTKVMDPAVYDTMKAMLAEKAAAKSSASTKKVKAEPGSNAPGSPSLCGNKRSLAEANGGRECPSRPMPSTAFSSGVCSPPPGCSRKPEHVPSRHGGDTTDWKAARELLQAAITPPQDREFAAREPSDIVKSSYAVILQAVEHTMELAEKLVAREAEVAALRAQLEEAKASLAASVKREKANLEPESDGAAAAAAAAHLLSPDESEHVRRRAEQALEGHQHWRGSGRTAAPRT